MAGKDKTTWPRLYMVKDPRLPMTYAFRTDRETVIGEGKDGKPLKGSLVYHFSRGKWTSVHPDDFDKLKNLSHKKNGQLVPLFGRPDDDIEESKTVNDEVADLKTKMEQALEAMRTAGVQVPEDDGGEASDELRRRCKSCGNVNAPGAERCVACGKVL